MLELIQGQPFLVAFAAGACAQFVKVLSFLILEKRVNLRRFVQTHGSPNMHSAAFSGLTVAVGFHSGFDSLAFSIAVCITAIIVVDTMNVKTATSKQAEAILLIMDRVRKRQPPAGPRKPSSSYTPVDVFTGMAVGIFVAMMML